VALRDAPLHRPVQAAWDQIEHRLEAIENHLARIANILEDRRGR
jgi:hypothetical protein